MTCRDVMAFEIADVIPGSTIIGERNIQVKRPVPLRDEARETLTWVRGRTHQPFNGSVRIMKANVAPPDLKADQAIIYCPNPRLGLAYALQEFWPSMPMVEKRGIGVRTHLLSVIGMEGNSVEWDAESGEYIRLPAQAGVSLCDNVRVGAFVAIVRGLLQDTIIGPNTEICNHVNVGHGARIGFGCIIAPFVAVGGSCRIGGRVEIWQGATIRNGVTIGEGTVIGQGANVVCDVPAGERWWGNPARKS